MNYKDQERILINNNFNENKTDQEPKKRENKFKI